ncbi:hypothetical protein M885DRAFT_505429 [Pelagophyceae sp. CCMP2097]|nr:hypothetical protein M885DRAFT_505429 [Pelagophyceae sp. CCMP2097]
MTHASWFLAACWCAQALQNARRPVSRRRTAASAAPASAAPAASAAAPAGAPPLRQETLALPLADLATLVGGSGRAKSIWEALMSQTEPLSPDSALSRHTRSALAHVESFVPAVLDALPDRSADGTTKILVKFRDGAQVEAVLIPHLSLNRTTLCISTQVGCDRGCTFCATARMGLVRNLDADEILAQVYLARGVAKQCADLGLGMAPLTNIVFMGMGDAGRNSGNVRRAVEALADRLKFSFAQSKITMSTVGPSPEAFADLAKAPGMLAWSVHSADDVLRKQLVPTHGPYTVIQLRNGLVRALSGRASRGRTCMIAATLIAGINDSDEDAEKLARFVGPIVDVAGKLSVDLIPCNPTDHAPHFHRPSKERLDAFAAKIREIEPRAHVACRLTRGDEGKAACGQLLVSRQRKQLREMHLEDDEPDEA